MKLCIPTQDDRGLESKLHGHFGSAPYFTVVDPEHGDLKVVRNPGCHQNSFECHHTPLLNHHQVDSVACTGIGRRAFAALRDAGVRVFAPQQHTVSEIVAAAAGGRLIPLSPGNACGGGQGHGRGEQPGHRRGHARGCGIGEPRGDGCHGEGRRKRHRTKPSLLERGQPLG